MSDEAFETFWRSYPRRVGKGEARRVFAKLNITPALLDRMLHALAWQSATDQWNRDDGQYIPHPATWLRQERWEDEPVVTRPLLSNGSRTGDTMTAALASLRRRFEEDWSDEHPESEDEARRNDHQRLGASEFGAAGETQQGRLRRLR